MEGKTLLKETLELWLISIGSGVHLETDKDGWMDDGWMDGWVEGWMDGWIDQWMDRLIN